MYTQLAMLWTLKFYNHLVKPTSTLWWSSFALNSCQVMQTRHPWDLALRASTMHWRSTSTGIVWSRNYKCNITIELYSVYIYYTLIHSYVISGFKHLANKKPLGNQHLTTISSVTTEIQGEYSSVVTLVKKGLDLRGFFRPHNSSGMVQRPQRRFTEDYLQAKFTTDSISALSGYIQARSWKATYQWLEIPHAKTNHGSEPQTNSRMPTLTNSC